MPFLKFSNKFAYLLIFRVLSNTEMLKSSHLHCSFPDILITKNHWLMFLFFRHSMSLLFVLIHKLCHSASFRNHIDMNILEKLFFSWNKYNNICFRHIRHHNFLLPRSNRFRPDTVHIVLNKKFHSIHNRKHSCNFCIFHRIHQFPVVHCY